MLIELRDLKADQDLSDEKKRADVIFLGTGTSEGIPRVTCLTANPPTCTVCTDAIRPGSKNRRRNTSIVIRTHPEGEPPVNLLVDAGKFFYHAAIQWFPVHQIDTIDAVLLTHAHADCTGGFDDLRDWTNIVRFATEDPRAETMKTRNGGNIPVYLRPDDLEVVAKTSYYLVDRTQMTSGGTVAYLDFKTIPKHEFSIHGIDILPLEVPHGPPHTANGYRIGDFAYISDVSEMPEKVMERLTDLGTLVIDALRWSRSHGSHLNVESAVSIAKTLRPERTLLTDASHGVDHYEANRYLRQPENSDGLDIQYAYDGLKISISI